MATILVVDDEKNYLWMLEELLREEGDEVLISDSAAKAVKILKEESIDVLLTDLRMTGMDGMALLSQSREISPTTATILMTAYGTIEKAVEAMREGAYDFIVKPFENEDLLRAVRKASERTSLLRENVRLSQALAGRYHFDEATGESHAIKQLYDKLKRVTDSKATILIVGESGSGKEVAARMIHFNSPRCGYPFLPVNCGALTETLAESELFGHERGAFTGANTRHAGLFEQADGGTLFLDEIGELPLPLQAKLLRVLDTQEIRRVGGEKTIHVDARVLAATNRDLLAEVQQERFREDLWYRLGVIRIEVPPLRERKEDIPVLAKAYLKQLKQDGSVRGQHLSEKALNYLLHHPWPGNIRQLQNAIAYAALMAKEEIQQEDFPVESTEAKDWLSTLSRLLPSDAPLDDTLKAIEGS
ncbi:MAG: sigma-54 dependent transcriptional regulator [Nitrospirales bacterium]|nr:sigma-54 dependent transcriptional regulator [Nitrospirales bacterium]